MGGARCESEGTRQFGHLDGLGPYYGLAWIDHLSSCTAERKFDCVSALWKQADGSEREMSTLRERLKRPEIYLAAVAAFFVLAGADALREPQKQWSARGYVAVVHFYQRHVSGRIASRAQCRFEPTCSHYSEEAVERYGIGRGLRMTTARLWRCRSGVATGTRDPVPEVTQTAETRRDYK
jgi:uncharacterized protein